MNMIIRQYRPADHVAVMELHFAGVTQVDPEGAIFDSSFDADLDDIPGNYLQARGDFLVGEVDGQIVAIGGLRMKSDTGAEIKRMRTRPDLQGRGYGKQILARLVERAVELGYSELLLDTLASNDVSRHFYENLGFTCSGRGKTGRYNMVYYSMKLPRR